MAAIRKTFNLDVYMCWPAAGFFVSMILVHVGCMTGVSLKADLSLEDIYRLGISKCPFSYQRRFLTEHGHSIQLYDHIHLYK